MFYAVERFPFTAMLSQNWQTIRQEWQALDDGKFHAWPEHSLYGEKGWDTFGLYAFGQRQRDNCRLFPKTEALLKTVPGLMMAGFSRLAPGAHIVPHRGYEGYAGHVLRLHLGLSVPQNCALRVETETREWRDGECLVFDDSFEHEAWNKSDQPRTVLLVDFINPLRRKPLILNPQFTPELIQFIETNYLPTQSFLQRLLWLVWKAANPGLVRQARRSIARDRPA